MAQHERAVSVHRIEFDVGWPPGHVASYLVDCGEPVLVDTGMAGADGEDRLREQLSAIDRDLADIEHLLITHPHVDHIGQVEAVLAAADPAVYAPSGVRERFARDLADLETSVRENAVAAGLSGEEYETAVEMAVDSLERNRGLLPREAVDVWVEDEEIHDISGTPVEVIHTPGHQADHCCFSVSLGAERALLVGDMAIEPFRPVALHTGLDRGVEEAIGAFKNALDRLSALDPDRVYPGHGPVHTDFEHVVERDRRSIDRMLERTVEMVGEDPKTAVEVATARASDADIAYILPEVVAALSHLTDAGRVEREAVDGIVHYRSR